MLVLGSGERSGYRVWNHDLPMANIMQEWFCWKWGYKDSELLNDESFSKWGNNDQYSSKVWLKWPYKADIDYYTHWENDHSLGCMSVCMYCIVLWVMCFAPWIKYAGNILLIIVVSSANLPRTFQMLLSQGIRKIWLHIRPHAHEHRPICPWDIISGINPPHPHSANGFGLMLWYGLTQYHTRPILLTSLAD